jgi:hypothetical protein
VPTYEFINTETGEHFERFMGMSAKEEFLKENPHIHQTMTQAPGLVSGVSTSKQNRVPDGFKEVLAKVAEAHPGSKINDRYHKKSIKEAKTAQVVQKHVDRITKREANKK